MRKSEIKEIIWDYVRGREMAPVSGLESILRRQGIDCYGTRTIILSATAARPGWEWRNINDDVYRAVHALISEGRLEICGTISSAPRRKPTSKLSTPGRKPASKLRRKMRSKHKRATDLRRPKPYSIWAREMAAAYHAKQKTGEEETI